MAKRFRFIIFIPFVTSALAFTLHLLLLFSGADVTTQPSGYFLLSIDTSHVFERIIVVKNTNNNTQAVGQTNGTNPGIGGGGGENNGGGTSTGTATGSDTNSGGGGLFDGIPNLLPNLKESATAGDIARETAEDARTGVRRFFGRIRNGVDQFWNGLVRNFENRFVDSVQKLAPGINRFISGLIGGLTREVNDQIQEFIVEGVQKGREVAGIKDRYDIFYSNICSGNLRDKNDPNSVQYTNCGSIKDLTRPSNEAPANRTTFFVVGTTNITFPFLEPGAVDLGSATVALDFMSTVNLASLYISLVTSILNFVLAPVVFFRPDSEKLVLANILFASLTPGSLLIGAVASTLIMAVLRDLAKDVGRALSVQAGLGAAALVMLWLSWVLSLATAAFWDLYWFVYLRKEVWVKMKKPADEVGSWKGTFRGARRRMKVREEEEELMDEEKRMTAVARRGSADEGAWGVGGRSRLRKSRMRDGGRRARRRRMLRRRKRRVQQEG
ncbi:hypothetical protein PG993_008266 [Apiospora rasikravindrae]|uniref:Uncharacterized protein n=1 Tax=Apiospora rasikravindrae TaxID=990691 RepID=A0ABR1SZV1_9PEZI